MTITDDVPAAIATPGRHIAPARLASPRRPQWITRDRVILLALMVVVAVVVGTGLTRYPALQDDEGTYAAQAWAVRHGELAPYVYWYDHPPLGWIQLALADWLPAQLRIGSAQAVASARSVMLTVAVLNAALLYTVARRLGLHRVFSTAAVLLYSLSPLTVVLSRQVYLDGLAVPWVLGALVLALSPRRHLGHYLAAGAALGIAALTKETAVLLLPAVLWCVLRRAASRLRVMAATSFLITFGAVVCLYPLFAALRRELFPGVGHVSLVGALEFQLFRRAGSGAIWQAGSDRRQLWDGWLAQDHWLLIIGLTGAVLALTWRAMWPVCAAVALVGAPIVKPGGYLPAMYVIMLLPFLAVAAAGAAQSLWVLSRQLNPARWLRPIGAAAGLALLATVAPAYAAGDRHVMTADVTAAHATAEAFVRDHISRHSTVLVDDSYWLDLVNAGWGAKWKHGAIWYYKLDLDSAARVQLPGGWRSIDYIILSPQMRSDISTAQVPQTATGVRNSRLLATFGTGDAAIEILDVRNGYPHPLLRPVLAPPAPVANRPSRGSRPGGGHGVTAQPGTTPSAPALLPSATATPLLPPATATPLGPDQSKDSR